MKQSIDHKGHQVSFTFQGAKNTNCPLVLVHGFCEDLAIFDPLMAGLEGLDVLRVDLPGFGASVVPTSCSIDHYADAVWGVLDALELSDAVVIGHSMGGYTALAMAHQQPERLKGFGLMHSHPYADAPDRVEARKRGLDLLKEGKRDLYVSQLFPGLFAPDFAQKEQQLIQQLIDQQGKQQSPEGIACGLQAMMSRADRTGVLQQFDKPVLWLLGAEDAIIPVEHTLEAAALCPQAVIHLMQGVGHMGMYEATDATAGHIRSFYDLCCRT